ncbi:Serpentine Receptor, class H [Caenorhabditis elegans]|uniref:Serpentine Receptor, class H n=1 Tax=Caenorhabditis elegans TaxID=6239 RepID=P91118_CAEEL|nr:Serpentine Receptor, class H [Caenorhabditis elegans]CCD66347.1 Serpentine Receptor, class H [Caenorhabditis elegans]|eukprot:NP_493874.1 Serpentine Receptor, class H [Caenorhabditis elegans]
MNFSSYFATPDFQAFALHLLISIETPIHLFATFCILFKTPISMKSVKFQMFNLHFWSIGLDLGISLLTIPYFLYPALAGFPLGVLNFFEVPVRCQAFLLGVLIGLLGVSIVTILENRYYLLFGVRGHWWRHFRITFLVLNYVIACVYFYPAYYYVPDQKQALQEVFEMLPELPKELQTSKIFVLATDFRFIVLPVFFMSTLLLLESGIFTFLIYKNMSAQSKELSLSPQTIKMQKQFLRALNIQTCIPLAILLIPLCYLVISRVFLIYNQVANNFCFITIGAHGLFSTLIMLYIHIPYRNFCVDKLCSKVPGFKRRTSRVVQLFGSL